MKHKIISISILIILLNLIYSQISFYEKSRIYFPEQLVNQNFTADYFHKTIDNSFLVLDKNLGSIYKFDLSGKITNSYEYFNLSELFGELIGVLVNSSGVSIFDKNNNQIFKLDHQLNLLTIDILDIPLHPEKVVLDSWGRINIYSKRLNGIFIYENGIDKKQKINLNHIPSYGSCISDFEVNNSGELAILGCKGQFYVFNILGKFRFSSLSDLKNPQFIISYNSNWIVFNLDGLGENLNDKSKIILPETKQTLKDIKVIDNRIALLYDSYISILNVQD